MQLIERCAMRALSCAAIAAVLMGGAPARTTKARAYKHRTYAARKHYVRSVRRPVAYTAQSNTVVLKPGTVIPVKLDTQLSSDQSQAGDTFTATVDDSRTAYRSILHGATLDGVVREATPQQGDNPGMLDLSFTRLRLADGRSYVLNGVPTSMDSKYLATSGNGVYVAKNRNKDERLKYAGIGAGAVALIKILGGKDVKLTDILIGGGLGYAAGTILNKKNNEAHDVALQPGTQVGVLLNNTVRYAKAAPGSTAPRY